MRLVVFNSVFKNAGVVFSVLKNSNALFKKALRFAKRHGARGFAI